MKEELSNEIKDKIVEIVNSASGMNIGTGLQYYLEEKINPILPTGYTYQFSFNMGGQTENIIKKDWKTVYSF